MTLDQIRLKLKRLECRLIREALEAEGWNQTRTAKALGCGLTTLRRIIERHEDLADAAAAFGPGQGRPPENAE